MSSKDFMKNAYLIPKVKELSENYGYSEAEILQMFKDEMMTYSKPKKEMMQQRWPYVIKLHVMFRS